MEKNTITINFENGDKEVINFDLDFINDYVGEYDDIEEYVEDNLEDEDDSSSLFEIPLSMYLSDMFYDYLDNNGIEHDRDVVEDYIDETGKNIFEHLGIVSIRGNLETEDTIYEYNGNRDNLIYIEDEWLNNLE